MGQAQQHTHKALYLAGLDAPVTLQNADALLPVLHQVLPNWPFTVRDEQPSAGEFLKISKTATGEYDCIVSGDATSSKQRDAVDCACQLVAEAAWEQIRSNPLWLCLHCAAVEFAGRLVLFPNRRRAGKSTLTAILTERGHRVFTDDFLPIEVDTNGAIYGRANGVAPRLRLPVPDTFSERIKTWVIGNTGPENQRYKYIRSDRIARRGARLPIGAIVILERQKSPTPPVLEPAARVNVMDVLIRQNFARILHSGRILRASGGVCETADLYRMTYFSAEDAATILEEKFEAWPTPVRDLHSFEDLQIESADLGLLNQTRPKFDATERYVQAPGATEITVEGSVYLADAAGLSIQKLNTVSGAIWRILEEPTAVEEISSIMQAVFGDVEAEQIQKDAVYALGKFVKAGLATRAQKSSYAAL